MVEPDYYCTHDCHEKTVKIHSGYARRSKPVEEPSSDDRAALHHVVRCKSYAEFITWTAMLGHADLELAKSRTTAIHLPHIKTDNKVMTFFELAMTVLIRAVMDERGDIANA